MSRKLIAVLAVLGAGAALGWPVEKTIELEPGKDKVVRIGAVDWFEVDDAKTVSVEMLESGNEMLLTALKPGRTLMMTFSEGKPLVWSLRVGKADTVKAIAEPLNATLKACPKLAYHPDAYERLVGEVGDVKCQKALLELLKSDAFDAASVSLVFEATVMAEQQKDIKAALDATKSPIQIHYEGATLVLEGKAEPKVYRKALWDAFRRSACRIALDDRAEQTDAGVPVIIER